jgi:poly(A) polymerase
MDDRELTKLGYSREGGQLALLAPGDVATAPERVLEAVRLTVEMGLQLDELTERAVRQAAGKLANVAPERLGPEWQAFASVGRKRAALELLDRLGGVESLLPEVFAMKGVEQPPEWHPEGDVWTHTLLSLEHLSEGDAFVTTATLLHDVGKPPTFEVADRIRFSKHDSIGGRMAHRIALRLGFTAAEAKDIEWIVRAHMRFKHVREMRPGRLKNLVLDPHFEVLAAVVRADCLASHGDTSDLDFALSAREKALTEEQKPEPLLRGRDLVELGFEPGPAFGEVLRQIKALQAQGKLRNRTQAKIFAKIFLQNFEEAQ